MFALRWLLNNYPLIHQKKLELGNYLWCKYSWSSVSNVIQNKPHRQQQPAIQSCWTAYCVLPDLSKGHKLQSLPSLVIVSTLSALCHHSDTICYRSVPSQLVNKHRAASSRLSRILTEVSSSAWACESLPPTAAAADSLLTPAPVSRLSLSHSFIRGWIWRAIKFSQKRENICARCSNHVGF